MQIKQEDTYSNERNDKTMNNTRRKAILELSQKAGNIKGEIEELMQGIEDIKGEEEDYKENIPENLQGGDKYEVAEAAIENLEEAYSNLDDIAGTLEDVESYLNEAAN